MLSHEDRALTLLDRHSMRAVRFSDKAKRDLTIEFKKILPEGFVAVDQEKLREALENWAGSCE